MEYLVFGLTAFLIILFDQLTKLFFSSLLTEGQTLWSFGFIHITLVHNTGAAFGIFPGQFLPLVIIRSLGIIVILLIFVYFRRPIKSWGGTLALVVLGLFLGGTAGNLIDQLRFHYVVDFVDLTYWPVFNVSDSSVVIAVIILIVMLLFLVKLERKVKS